MLLDYCQVIVRTDNMMVRAGSQSLKGCGFTWGAGVGGRVGRGSVHDFGVDDHT